MSPPTNLEKAEHERALLKTSLVLIEQAILVRATTPLDQTDCELYVTEVRKMEEDLQDIHFRILCTKPTDMDVHNAEYALLKKSIFKARSTLETLYKSFAPATPPPQPEAPRSSIKLAPVNIPTFTGKYEEWSSFKDLYEALIHNTSQADATKLAYLKTYVGGDAAVLIQNITITNSNYNEAWNLLKKRYDNKREIVYSQVRRLFNIGAVKNANAVSIQTLIDQTNECVRALKVLGEKTDEWDTLLVYMTVDKFDVDTKRKWAEKLTSTNLPKYSELCDFIEQHVRGLHAFQPPTSKTNSYHEKKANANFASSSSNHQNSYTCGVCSGNHSIHKCTKFLSLSVKERMGSASKNNLCFNCLRPASKSHNAETCRAAGCQTCQKKHNTLLHLSRMNNPTNQSDGKAGASPSTTKVNHVKGSDSNTNTDVLLSTAIVSIPNAWGAMQDARILLDSGSQATLISDSFVKRCGFPRSYDKTKVTGVGGTDAGYTLGKTSLNLISKVYADADSLPIEALILPKVTNDLPNFPCVSDYDHLSGITLADPAYHKPGPIDILLGAEYTGSIQRKGKITSEDSIGPVAINTIFGWALSGRVDLLQSNTVRIQVVNICETDNILKQYFELESVPTPMHFTDEEKECENHFVQNFSRGVDGRFSVKLPFNNKVSELGQSREMAIRRWQSVERRLAKNPQHADEYYKFMKEYLDLGHMAMIPAGEVNLGKSYYLPHHFVVKPDSSTTKFRVVFDGSAKTSSGVSLNDSLRVGATLQDDIFSLLLRFRQHQIAIKADIAKMFRQFGVSNEHCNFQRIVWREKPSDPIVDYKLMTITYGTASAPFLSTRCLIELARQNKSSFPKAAHLLEKDIYVDDLMSGGETEEEVKSIIKDLNQIVSSACLQFRKWSTNNEEVLRSIPVDLRESKEPLSFDKDSNVKALGIQWNALGDNFSFNKPDISGSALLTKREVLSQLAKVFDPLGFLSPVTINAKLFMQRLWKCELNWDDKLTSDLAKQWIAYQEQLKSIERIIIPRYARSSNATDIELHSFSDASEKAYGAVVYMRCKVADGVYEVKMLASKSRVAPLKTVSLPRLELCGALLLAELTESVKTSLNLQCETFAWSDSMIVLQWLDSHPGRWQTFVANRVAKIQEIIPYQQWNHVRSEDNPADMISRGITATAINEYSLWWSGPEWLSTDNLPKKPMPKRSTQEGESSLFLEERKKPIFISHVLIKENFIERYSSIFKLKRAVAYLIRFKCYLKTKTVQNKPLTPAELENALMSIVRIVQREAFPKEYGMLEKANLSAFPPNDYQQSVSPKSKLLALDPYLDEHKVIRVGGRLENAQVSKDIKHPIILPQNCHLTTLLIRAAHLTLKMHAGNKSVWCNLRRKWWIISAKNAIRFQLRKCVVCRRLRAKAMTQQMGNFPTSRITLDEVFLQTGVDYAGPFKLKVMHGRSNKLYKAYMCVFVCMATKAVHLEAVSEMTTAKFIGALQRFTGRRGIPQSIHSDCGTNFVGADNELAKLLSDDDHNKAVANDLSQQGITWEFNVPAAPHHGGIWEAAVKSAKFHLKCVVGERSLTYEEFATVLTQVEACLNSRPLGALTSDPDDLDVLTPGHFLIHRPLTSIPSPDYTEVIDNRLSRWELTQKIQQLFWKRWQAEYLTTLQQRWKWKNKSRNICVGDLCVLIEEKLSPTQWKLARVVETDPGQDNLVRKVTVKTADALLKRPITKLCPILFMEEQEEINFN